jgi:SAM-dependent methyltransferase
MFGVITVGRRAVAGALLTAKAAARKLVPLSIRQSLRRAPRLLGSRAQAIDFGSLRRVTPISRHWGADRGLPIDRFYIESFLQEHARDVRGHVLEVRDDAYTRRFGGDRVDHSDVLHVVAGTPNATIIADLTRADHVPSETFDCVILTQTLQLIYDVRAALQTLHRILRPGGVLLATFPGISHIARRDMERWGDYWRFTTLSAQRLFAERFSERVAVHAYGNVLATVGFLHGLATHELRREELVHADPDYQLVVAVRAVKGAPIP